jgi:predicted dithiol-disulfide oxidoreductase (DUF899 family)
MTIAFPNESAEHRAARNRLLDREIALRREIEAVAAERRALPPGGLIPEDYVFEGLGDDGAPAKVRLSELFAPGRDSLIVYNMMFPRHAGDTRPGPTEGSTAALPLAEGPCPSCVALIDQLEGAARHVAPKANLVVVAQAPIDRLAAFARERGWRRLRFCSSAGTRFKRDYHATFDDGQQAPMVTVFHRDSDGVRHVWSSEMFFAASELGQDPRHAGLLEPVWNLFDLTPEGRDPTWDEQLDYDCCA